jgi:hypothetical protein
MKKILLTSTDIAMAAKHGLTPREYAKKKASLMSWNPNTDPTYSISIEELVNLWQLKYGHTWVDVSEIEEEFWLNASRRLHKNNKLEETEGLQDNTPWARLKEEA